VGGTPILTVRLAAGGMSAQERATAIQARVNHLLSIGPLYPQDISAVPLPDGEAAVDVKGILLVTADFDTARIGVFGRTKDQGKIIKSIQRKKSSRKGKFKKKGNDVTKRVLQTGNQTCKAEKKGSKRSQITKLARAVKYRIRVNLHNSCYWRRRRRRPLHPVRGNAKWRRARRGRDAGPSPGHRRL
jgi:hypothetical protein